ncbi:Dihydrofolate reductase [Actinopolymorpha cephalotaxi]|uniref:Dihydrofolate reductase n=1 Tax=Actinopolymorpha cephalotaxi TaxID=504797 RepID=A0A1I2WZZ1_9ACTN|nr:dihydrofolate reductase family protein [Actinopolymorpha cephalotaxi]NYH85187.1 dihydrofolate reductase [Actinopolymorpha cephalotaxi]SFH06016.1 Dihydrofolate reductase [Actinopolymorpha cephalotaxi]
MGTIKVVNFVTLDGVIQSPLFADEDRDGGFVAGGWVSDRMDDAVAAVMSAETTSAAAMLLGRRTYDGFAAAWSGAEPSDPVDAMNRMPKYVLSREGTSGSWQHTVALSEVADVERVKLDTDGTIVVFGSSGLLPALFAARLVDELCLLVFPVVLGAGKRMFSDGTPPLEFRLLDSDSTPTGVAVLRYALG